jgi:hypothetical protein
MLGSRYRVEDPEKAAPLLDRGAKPFVIDEATGAKLAVPNPPKAGPLRARGVPRPETNCFVLFSNPGGLVKRGGKATVVIGEFRAEVLIVQ